MARTKKFKRDEVLEKAMMLFWEKGFHACSMQDLVSGLGINRASMYDTFGSKLDLYKESLNLYHLQTKSKTADFLYQQVLVRQGLYLRFENFISEVELSQQAFGCFIQSALNEMSPQDEEMRISLKHYIEEQELAYYNYLAYGQAQGQISPYKDLKSLGKQLFELEMNIKAGLKLKLPKETLQQHIEHVLTVLA